MEPTNQDTNNTMNASMPVQNGLQNLLHKKWFIIAAGVVILLMLGVGIFLATSPKKASEIPEKTKPSGNTKTTPTPTNSPELEKAIDEAKQSAQTYNETQAELVTDYPWLRTLPLANEKYFVYFDLDKEVFIGRLYPKPGENVEQMKSLIQQQLKVSKGIPVADFEFEWVVNPK
jgi:hypothetical protein